ncbi:leucyl/phenylalanyl-tRNA--protein transferase [Xanthomonas hortorum]|uniref:Leucyl/phenylalanyl-tRNA--protein transferase n=1 Tax=Xanthomonas hortorum pv. hederae TaxID=453603 RepID=A0A9X4H4J8_9XANT|nr:leucyl/phenylalanyl-tRNA--protein transferase [Xanthomonas hortorum]MCE4371181.1 leucyl/phenylalanyl-tRNA--protein transferase [Xanthomonas hortorum pv. hederae]MDC8638216.1 leucyl/phenylalanyl-tRNA--protein transferase [Xanthomonas hortorum pv. hederae]PPU85959.1 leucyl/phenylalanyl-tRNA--protein transferase [Xanthomonas hortorum pv. hederae]PUE99657.1 leucyl/phenylalanyl-tRNA--protein transferase [Xanthomonas hortorum pv. hederae]
MSRPLPYLLDADPAAPFPPVEHALREPDGLLALGGDLSSQRLLNAYANGIFPWFSDDQPILWWSPDPRTVFRTNAVHLSSRFRRELRRSSWTVRADTAFAQVIDACASVPRAGQHGTWITTPMQQAYSELHRLGHAHSLEVFDDTRLIGGIYGVAIGQMFFGESMFSAESGGSKVALVALADYLHACGWPLIDAQVENPHLMRLGAQRLPRAEFLQQVRFQVAKLALPDTWSERHGERPASALADVRLT